jgi:hypothetical protein
VWDHIFLVKDAPANCAIPAATLQAMRREFEYWYPFDLRVSGETRAPDTLPLPSLVVLLLHQHHPHAAPCVSLCETARAAL